MEISVLLPVHNCGKYLMPALQSLAEQTFEDFEVLMVNDHSTDGSERVCEDFAKRDNRFKLLHSSKRGVAAALNHGLSQARGVYLARMDGDDISYPDRFARQLRFMQDNPDISFLGTCADHINERGKVIGAFEFPEDDVEIKACLDRGLNTFIHPSMMIKRIALEAIGGYREVFTICQDYDLWLRARDHYDFANLGEKLFGYRGYAGKRDINARFWLFFYITTLANVSAEERRLGKVDPVEQMIDAFDVDAIDDERIRNQLMSSRQDYYSNKKAFVDKRPLNSLDIDQVRRFLLNNQKTFNKKALGEAFMVLFDQAIRINDSETAKLIFSLQSEISRSRHVKSMLASPRRMMRYAFLKQLEPA